ncbi:methionine gamma-lyase family protein [Ihubacter massiliensis]|uniref:Methionine gamma-lyase family protein n=1 Tax=Hominibacterium faecale TaxID=2839743 RepID=A0A9J6QKA7_9FIRM|nr:MULTISPECIES: methionine gamma-lyase family protein [Eubacteriales Family XIII. Incertae Sedis]MCC2865280.1 methionine gamma-lyase family protein [Anaerovorax odorimutans]MCI7303884.1 methionine gamma-lyase family protein [Clostridia bacterium]MDY3011639.1 methionine gamma-lyase family protein [Clostridiales Family XIII bacterium]MCO7120996.1 methionine gamma-lyase family protein [Ihubacter massiliensis]MCU7377912.1 methionine gamma-lyase family protein [Hominibacterium faecale]
MQTNTYRLLSKELQIAPRVLDHISEAEEAVKGEFDHLDDIMAYNQYKVLTAFQKNRISDTHFAWNTGYGYDDAGRDALERVYADIFKAEAALVRPIIVNGTHALTLTLTGILRPGDELIYCTGAPYDTLEEVIGIRGEGKGSLREFGVSYKQVELTPEGNIDLTALKNAITEKTRMVTVQRATGYGWRKAITIPQIREWADFVHQINPNIVCMVDNCYGEFLDTEEPTEVGADVLAGSLIKNPGGGLALTGGYIAGKKELIDLISYRMTSPGIGGECGLTFGQTRTMFQGLFLAPKTVNGAVKGAVLCAKAFEMLEYDVCPKAGDTRSDIIEAVKLGSPEAVVAFCEGIQAAAPIDAYVKPIPWDMPGYEDQVVMAAGAFVQGSSIELSADAPIREPYIVYFQGGLTYEHSKFGVIKALQTLYEQGLVSLD